MINILKEGMLFFVYHPFIASFFSGFISEELLLFTAIESGRGLLPLWTVLIFGFLGMTAVDSFLFWVAKTRLIRYIADNKLISHNTRKIDKKLKKIDETHKILSLILTKFIYGTRIVTIFYHSTKKMPYKTFLAYDSIALATWSLIMIPIGWLAGRGFTKILRFARGTEKLLAIVLLVLIIFYVANFIVKKYLLSSKKLVKNKI